MDLIITSSNPREIPASARKSLMFRLSSMTIPMLESAIKKRTDELALSGFDIFRLNFYVEQDDDSDSEPWCAVQGSRLETSEEVDQRIKRDELYNARQIREHATKMHAVAVSKEIKRLTGHLTLEQLKALQPLNSPDSAA